MIALETLAVSNASESARRFEPPRPQTNFARAAKLGFNALGRQSDEQFRWLGAEPVERGWRVPVLGDVLEVDPSESRITTSAGREVGPHWSVLVLHYLAARERPEQQTPAVTFADLPRARSYAGIYHGRVNLRLCATIGREGEALRTAAMALGGRDADGGNLAFDFDPFPRLTMRLIWHAPDEEFPPSATLLLPPNMESYLCSEDIVVLSECLVSRLSGRPF